MTSIGTGYDLSNSTYSPDGRNFQCEYAGKAVENGGTSIGIRCMNGVVLATEKLITSKLLKPGANNRIGGVDRSIGIVYSGLIPDGRHFISRARDEASSWRDNYKGPIPVASLADRMGSYVQAYTLYNSVRPFGITAIIAGYDSDVPLPVDGQVGSGPNTGGVGRITGAKLGGPGLYMIEPSGLYWGYYGAATGKGRQTAKAELEKLNLSDCKMQIEDAVIEAARIIHLAHDDNKDKEFELEMSWISDAEGPTKGRYAPVPRQFFEEAEKEAKRLNAIARGEDDDEEEEEEEDENMEE